MSQFLEKKKQKKQSKNLTFRFYEVNSSDTGDAIVSFISSTNANTEIVLFWVFFGLLGAFFYFYAFYCLSGHAVAKYCAMSTNLGQISRKFQGEHPK